MSLIIRSEEKDDYRTSEEITKEAFWNIYVPGCDEHLYLHKLRKSPAFIPELAFVAVLDGKLVGNIAYTQSKLVTDSGKEIKTITFGPVSVLPSFQNKGIGKALINHTINVCRSIGYPAILIFGYPGYYCKYGFEIASKYGISNSEGKYPRALQILPLFDGVLDDIKGKFFECYEYSLEDGELDAFDKTFPKKEKGFAESQNLFKEMSSLFD